MSNSQTGNGAPEEENARVSTFDLVSDLVTGSHLPAPIRKNIFKTFGQLCSSLVDVPVAYFEGRSDEIRAGNKARVHLIETAADQIAHQMRVDPEYARVAATKYGHKIVREQANLDMISKVAAIDLKDDGTLEDRTTPDEVDDDWMDNFENEARKKSSEEMQLYFGRVLAGEIKKPTSFSIKAVKILGEMDQEIANLFGKLCSLCVTLAYENGEIIDVRVPSLGGDPGDNCLVKYDLGYRDFNVLNEYGLVVSDYNSWRNYEFCIGTNVSNQLVRFPFLHQKKHWVLEPNGQPLPNFTFGVQGVSLTRSGRELFGIVPTHPVHEFTEDLAAFFQKNGLKMVEVPSIKPQILQEHGWTVAVDS